MKQSALIAADNVSAFEAALDSFIEEEGKSYHNIDYKPVVMPPDGDHLEHYVLYTALVIY